MAKAFLLRWGSQNDFDSIKLQTRELGFTVDTEKLYVGTDDANVHIPSEGFIATMISNGVKLYKPNSGTTLELSTSHTPGTFAFDTDAKRMKYKSPTGMAINVASLADLPSSDPVSVVVAAENIDGGDSNSVTLTGYTRPIRLVYLNGRLCTNNAADTHKYTVDTLASTLKINECVAGDIIAYF